MAGEVFYLVTAAEVKRIRKDPAAVRALDIPDRRSLRLEQVSYNIDCALEIIRQETDTGPVALAVSLENDIGSAHTPVKHVTAGRAAEVARALAAVSRELFIEAFQEANCECGPDLAEECHLYFKELVQFYAEAAKRKKAVVKTIY
jgi:hypothetical protein